MARASSLRLGCAYRPYACQLQSPHSCRYKMPSIFFRDQLCTTSARRQRQRRNWRLQFTRRRSTPTRELPVTFGRTVCWLACSQSHMPGSWEPQRTASAVPSSCSHCILILLFCYCPALLLSPSELAWGVAGWFLLRWSRTKTTAAANCWSGAVAWRPPIPARPTLNNAPPLQRSRFQGLTVQRMRCFGRSSGFILTC